MEPRRDGCGAEADTEGGEVEAEFMVEVVRRDEPESGPRLCGNCSGRGREWVRSKRPHLLQS